MITDTQSPNQLQVMSSPNVIQATPQQHQTTEDWHLAPPTDKYRCVAGGFARFDESSGVTTGGAGDASEAFSA